MTNKSTMTNIRHDYADKRWLIRCPDEASDPVAWIALATVIWAWDIAAWTA